MGFGNADDAAPGIEVSGRMPGLWEDAAFERAADESLLTVDQELSSPGRDFARAVGEELRVATRKLHQQWMQCWAELIPEFAGSLRQQTTGLHYRPRGRPLDWDLP